MRLGVPIASLRLQVSLMFGSVACVAVLSTWAGSVAAVRVALSDHPRAITDQVVAAVGAVAVVTGGGVLIACVGAALYLRASLGGTVREMQEATVAIATGGFQHRIATTRRDELGGLAASIDHMATRLCELEQSRRRMLAAVSHELRTPLTIIRGHAFTLSRDERDDERKAAFALIDGETERLASLIDELLAAATLSARPVQLVREECEIGVLLQEVVGRFSHTGAARRIHIVLESDNATISVDRSRFEQAVGNLVANAVAHAPERSRVAIRARLRGRLVRVSVENGGRAIEPSLLPLVFEPFMQGQAPTGSVGLGLSIVRDLVRAHGSEVHVRSRKGRTTFWFDLERAGEVGVPNCASASPTMSNPRIVVAHAVPGGS